MSNSPLISYRKISPNRTSPRNHKIDTITIHCYVGQATVEQAGNWFGKSTTQASCNYMIGYDGRIALIVDEQDRSWCSSNPANDHRAITIECASEKEHPYEINDRVYESLINLCADICKRNDIDALRWKNDKTLIGQPDKQNLTVHRWFKNKACPGEYIFSRLGKIADEVNKKLNTVSTPAPNQNVNTGNPDTVNNFPKTPFEVQVLIDDLHYREKPSMSGAIKGDTKKGIFTIVDVQDGWGKLKSGVGYIWLKNPEYCKILEKSIDSGKPTATPKKTVTEIAKEVLAGKWGNGDARKKAIEAAGYNYNEVQQMVNKLLGTNTVTKKSINVIAQEVIAGKWGNGDARRRNLTKAGYNYEEVQKRVNEIM